MNKLYQAHDFIRVPLTQVKEGDWMSLPVEGGYTVAKLVDAMKFGSSTRTFPEGFTVTYYLPPGANVKSFSSSEATVEIQVEWKRERPLISVKTFWYFDTIPPEKLVQILPRQQKRRR